MLKTIAHISDIHLRKSPTRNAEYEEVFENLYTSLKAKNPDVIVLVGDLVHDYLDLQGEQLVMASNFLNRLAEIAPLRVTRGNHDCRKKSIKRTDSIEAIIKSINNPNIIYYNKTGFYVDGNIIWAVWHHGDKNINPWKNLKDKNLIDDLNSPHSTYTSIDLYHDPINGCVAMNGHEMKSKSLTGIKEFRGTYSLFGDIHKMQYLNTEQTKAYSGSLIAQDFGEGDENFHGYLLWDIENKSVEEIPIGNNYSYKTINLTPFIDFDDLDFEIENPTQIMKVRFMWSTLPNTRSKINEVKLSQYIKSKYGTVTIAHKNNFIETTKVEVNNKINLTNISDVSIQHEIFREYLVKIGVDSAMIDDIIKLDDEISASIDNSDSFNNEWNIIKFGVVNFMSYGKFDIDWRDMDGLFQISGGNTYGKTTILKAITYILFGKTLETDSRMKFGDKRFINNRNGAKFCDSYLVLESGGEYFGVQRKTTITTTVKEGIINGAPTVLSYYQLASPDDEMNKDNAVENLEEDKRIQTQKKIDGIIGTYDNFMRVVMTTSDTLNNILSNEMATFMDSLLFDSGLDIFDKKLKGLKAYQDKKIGQVRYSCNIEQTNEQINLLGNEIKILDETITNLETINLVDVRHRLATGQTFVDDLNKQLYKIDEAIYTLNLEEIEKHILVENGKIHAYNDRLDVLNETIKPLKKTYDVERLTEVLNKKEEHRGEHFAFKLEIRTCEQAIRDEEHEIEKINGLVFGLKRDGAKKKEEIQKLGESKTCPTCHQSLDEKHQVHIADAIKVLEDEMYVIADEITALVTDQTKVHTELIDAEKAKIIEINKKILASDGNMESILQEIGKLTNDKNDVEKRESVQVEIDNIPIRIKNSELIIESAQQKIDNYNNSILQIEANKNVEHGISLAKARIKVLSDEERDYNEDIFIAKSNIAEKLTKIQANKKLVDNFTKQMYEDSIIAKYKDCVHRDGIPKQMLSNYIIPKINITLEEVLSVAPFKVWLDEEELKPKLLYNDRPAAIIDCISASGKERTFSSVPIKFALNQINVKAKPTIFLLDEVMGKLDPEAVEEFVEMLTIIKNSMKKLLVIEQVHEINPDFLINVSLDEEGISSLTIE